MALKRLTIIVWVCALYCLEPGFTSWNVSTSLTVPKQWGSTPAISQDPLSALTEFALQLMLREEHNARKRVKVTPIRATEVEPCSKEHSLISRGPGMEVKELHHCTGKSAVVFKRSRGSHTSANGQSHEVTTAENASLRGTAVKEAVHRVEIETNTPGGVVWVISFHRVCLLATMGLLARITIQILVQDTDAPEKSSKSEGQRELSRPGACPITVLQSRPATTTKRKGRGMRSCNGC